MEMEKEINVSEIKEEHYDKLSRLYGVSADIIRKAHAIIKEKEEREIRDKFVPVIGNNVNDRRSGNADFYFEKVLLPYLKFLVRGLKLPENIENKIIMQFNTVFDSKEENPLGEKYCS